MNSQYQHRGYLAMAGPALIQVPCETDAAGTRQLIEGSPQLDNNSCYTYLLQVWHFSVTCVYAEVNGQAAGYIAAYIPPRQPDTLFIWQIVVAPRWQGIGLARNMLLALLQRPACAVLSYTDSTVSKGKRSSEGFFRHIGERLYATLATQERLPVNLVKPDRHASERRFHISPASVAGQNPYAGGRA